VIKYYINEFTQKEINNLNLYSNLMAIEEKVKYKATDALKNQNIGG
jgi:hypothetical protein